jgi:predicted MPP superfamily phosphohydrolase
MVPGLEEMRIRMLLNECEVISRDDQRIYLAGIDDARYYRVDNIEKAASGIPHDGILLSHTPEICRQAAQAGFYLLLGGHTHGGQICLPAPSRSLWILDSVLPRRMGAGSWKYHEMMGYTSVGVGSSIVAVRVNCLPEITLHHLRCG